MHLQKPGQMIRPGFDCASKAAANMISALACHTSELNIIGEKQAMEEEKKRKIEDQLRLLVAEADLKKSDKRPVKKMVSGVKVIRRRKGQPDLLIA